MSCLAQYTREITKEQYDEIMAASHGRGFIPSDLETRYFSESTIWGYGLYGTKVYEKDGKYILWYETGTTCD